MLRSESRTQRPNTTIASTELVPPPARRCRDVFSPTDPRTADRLRDFLRNGLAALMRDAPNVLVLPPPIVSAARLATGGKHVIRDRHVEIGIVTRGDMAIWWEGVTTHCPAGSIFVIPPGMRYLPHVGISGREILAHSVVWLALHRGCAIAHICALEGDAHHLSEYYSFTDPQVSGQARGMAQELADRSTHYGVAIRGSLLCLFTWLLRAPVHWTLESVVRRRARNRRRADSFSDQVRAYMYSHYHRPLTLAQVARSVGCSPAYLCRRFRELTGQTPFQFLRAVRIDTAKSLLLSDIPISRVAEMVGFDDPLYFSKVFSKVAGLSPQAYSDRCRGRERRHAT